MKELGREIRWRANHLGMDGEAFFKVKKDYKDDPIFSGSKVVLSLYGDTPKEVLAPDFNKTILFGGIKPEDAPLPKNATGMELAQLAAKYSEGIIFGDDRVDPALAACVEGLGVPVLPFDAAALADGSYMEAYNDFYDSILR